MRRSRFKFRVKDSIVDELDDVKQWSVVTNNIGTDDCSEKTLEVFLTNYFNEFENKIHANVKQLNDNFMLCI